MIQRCTGCHAVTYCDKVCQKKHWKDHKVLCSAIQQLEEIEDQKVAVQCEVRKNSKLVDLVGKRPEIECGIGGVRTTALWDTGSQVSMLSKAWLDENNIEEEIVSITSVLGRDITVEGVSGSTIPYDGVVTLRLGCESFEEDVPFLVTSQAICGPIIGFNVIAAMVKNNKGDLLNISDEKIRVLKTIVEDAEQDVLTSVTVRKAGVILNPGSSVISCQVSVNTSDRIPALFESELPMLLPEGVVLQSEIVGLRKGLNTKIALTVCNTSSNPIRLRGRMKLGQIVPVKSITPVEVKGIQNSEQSPDLNRPDKVTIAESRENPTTVVKDKTNEKFELHADEKETTDTVKVLQTKDAPSKEEDEAYKEAIDKIDLSMLSEEERLSARQVLWEERQAFSINDEIGCAPDLQMNIQTKDEVPVQRAYNSIPRPLLGEVKSHVEDMLNRGWITRSKSAWSSPVVIVRKKSGEIRLCCDFRKLNAKTVQDKHPLPRVQASLDALQGSKWFSVLDQSRAYYQGFIAEEDRHKTAFVTPWGLYQWVRIPFGLINSPANFQRHMENVVDDFRDEFAIPYLDDIIVYDNNFGDHLRHIRTVLQRIKEKGLKLKLSKCELFKKEVNFLGHVVSAEGYRMDDKNIEAVRRLGSFTPKNVGDVRLLLGMLGYHRRHIQDFSRLAKPITNLLLGSGNNGTVSARQAVEWDSACQEAATLLIERITEAPILVYPDFNKDFVVHTDASGKGLGAILYQVHDNKHRVVAYASRTLHKTESKYHPTKLEFLALRWALTEAFHDYLAYSNHFKVFTDSNPLTFLMSAEKLGAFGERWVSQLAEYNFDIFYRPGRVHKDADTLSRIPLDIEKYTTLCTEEVSQDVFQAVMAGISVRCQGSETWRVNVNALSTMENAMEENQVLHNQAHIRKQQSEDPAIAKVMKLMKDSTENTEQDSSESTDEEADEPEIVENDTQKGDYEFQLLKKQMSRLFIKDEIMYRRAKWGNQLVLPLKLRYLIYKHCHIEMGHLGTERVLELARRRVFWPRMKDDIDNFIHQKCLCIMHKKPHRTGKAPLQSILTTAPMELISVDFLKLEKGTGGNQYVLLIVDHFTRFAQGYACTNKSAKTAAVKLYNDFVLRFGFPNKILSDQGGEFQNRLFDHLHRLAGVEKLKTTPYHPQCNGLCERMNETLIGMLRTLSKDCKSKWPTAINKMIHAYNSTQQSITGYSPFFMMFGREPRIPLDLLLETEWTQTSSKKSYDTYITDWQNQMEAAYEIAQKRTCDSRQKGREKFNEKAILLSEIQADDRVLVKNLSKSEGQGTHKLKSYWEEEVYVVVKRHPENETVYYVRKESSPSSKCRILHRNLLLPIGNWVNAPDINQKVTQREKRQPPSKGRQLTEEASESEDDLAAENEYSVPEMEAVGKEMAVQEVEIQEVTQGENSVLEIEDVVPEPEVSHPGQDVSKMGATEDEYVVPELEAVRNEVYVPEVEIVEKDQEGETLESEVVDPDRILRWGITDSDGIEVGTTGGAVQEVEVTKPDCEQLEEDMDEPHSVDEAIPEVEVLVETGSDIPDVEVVAIEAEDTAPEMEDDSDKAQEEDDEDRESQAAVELITGKEDTEEEVYESPTEEADTHQLETRRKDTVNESRRSKSASRRARSRETSPDRKVALWKSKRDVLLERRHRSAERLHSLLPTRTRKRPTRLEYENLGKPR